MALNIKQVASGEDIQSCFAVISQLRPHLIAKDFTARVESQMQLGYRLACATDNNAVVAVAGYRISQSLSWGKYLYVDDLITDAARRSEGIGRKLLNWLKEEASRNGCGELHLDSGTQRKDAHRFYEREGMEMLANHFKITI